VEYGSLIQRLEEQDAEAEQMEDKLTHLAREVDLSRLNAGENLWPQPESRNKAYRTVPDWYSIDLQQAVLKQGRGSRSGSALKRLK
jgi:hypothetical protein